MSNYIFKEVYFNNFCYLCKYKENTEEQDPCDRCLSAPVNENSHMPLYYERKEKTDA